MSPRQLWDLAEIHTLRARVKGLEAALVKADKAQEEPNPVIAARVVENVRSYLRRTPPADMTQAGLEASAAEGLKPPEPPNPYAIRGTMHAIRTALEELKPVGVSFADLLERLACEERARDPEVRHYTNVEELERDFGPQPAARDLLRPVQRTALNALLNRPVKRGEPVRLNDFVEVDYSTLERRVAALDLVPLPPDPRADRGIP